MSLRVCRDEWRFPPTRGNESSSGTSRKEAAGAASTHPLPHSSVARCDRRRRRGKVCLDKEAQSYLLDHRVQGHVVFPAASYVEVALEAAEEHLGAAPWLLEDVDFHRALVVPEATSHCVFRRTCKRRSRASQSRARLREGRLGRRIARGNFVPGSMRVLPRRRGWLAFAHAVASK